MPHARVCFPIKLSPEHLELLRLCLERFHYGMMDNPSIFEKSVIISFFLISLKQMDILY